MKDLRFADLSQIPTLRAFCSFGSGVPIQGPPLWPVSCASFFHQGHQSLGHGGAPMAHPHICLSRRLAAPGQVGGRGQASDVGGAGTGPVIGLCSEPGKMEAAVRKLTYENNHLQQYIRRESVRIFGVKQTNQEMADEVET
jgi:hypothetical protein